MGRPYNVGPYSQTVYTPRGVRQAWFEARSNKSCCIFAQPYIYTNKSADYVAVDIRSQYDGELTISWVHLQLNMPKFNPPEAMPFDAPSEWPFQEWRERFCHYLIPTRLPKDWRRYSDVVPGILWIPSTVRHPVRVDPKDDYDVVLAKFEKYFVPKRNKIDERAQFYQHSHAS